MAKCTCGVADVIPMFTSCTQFVAQLCWVYPIPSSLLPPPHLLPPSHLLPPPESTWHWRRRQIEWGRNRTSSEREEMWVQRSLMVYRSWDYVCVHVHVHTCLAVCAKYIHMRSVHAWDGSPHLLVTPGQLMRLDVGQTHTFCSVDAFSTYTYVCRSAFFRSVWFHWLIIHVCEEMWSTLCTEENIL